MDDPQRVGSPFGWGCFLLDRHLPVLITFCLGYSDLCSGEADLCTWCQICSVWYFMICFTDLSNMGQH